MVRPKNPRLPFSFITTVAAAGVILSQLMGHYAYAVDTPNISPPAPLSFIHSQGAALVDESGKRVILKGCNLGNWLLIELWMFGGCIQTSDQAHLFAKFQERFGDERTAQLMDSYRSSCITARDFDLIRSFGFNVVRLPIDYRLMQSDQAPYAMKPEAFKWLDRAVSLAQASGTYIILDMHAAPGGQSNDQCTGESGTNKLWNNPVNQQRTADLWRAIAEHYRDRSTVAGYDLMNEPYADHHMDVRGELRKIMAACYTAIRGTGDQHVVFFPGALGASPEFYDDPHATGWTNVGFTEHFYPGLFGDKVAFESHIRTLTRTFPARQKWLDRVQSPYYIGEFNPVLDAIGGPRITRAYYDAFAQRGWAGTIWSYKLLKPTGGATSNTWYCVSNADALPKLDLNSSTFEQFQQFFSDLATIPLAVNRPLQDSLTQPNPEPLPLTPAAGPEADANLTASVDEGQPLLKNQSFETAGSEPGAADGWISTGDEFQRETEQKFAHSGTADMAYRDGQAYSAHAAFELGQDVPAIPGRRYHFSVFAVRDNAGAANDGAKVELKLQGTLDGRAVTLNSTTVRAVEIGDGGKWTRLQVDGMALGDTLHVAIIVMPGKSSPPARVFRFDDAALQLVNHEK